MVYKPLCKIAYIAVCYSMVLLRVCVGFNPWVRGGTGSTHCFSTLMPYVCELYLVYRAPYKWAQQDYSDFYIYIRMCIPSHFILVEILANDGSCWNTYHSPHHPFFFLFFLLTKERSTASIWLISWIDVGSSPVGIYTRHDRAGL